MLLPDSALKGLPVFNEAGERLGRVSGFVFDAATHAIAHYAVERSGLLSAILPVELVVRIAQVVSLDAEKMVVRGDLVRELELEAAMRRDLASAKSAVSAAVRVTERE